MEHNSAIFLKMQTVNTCNNRSELLKNNMLMKEAKNHETVVTAWFYLDDTLEKTEQTL